MAADEFLIFAHAGEHSILFKSDTNKETYFTYVRGSLEDAKNKAREWRVMNPGLEFRIEDQEGNAVALVGGEEE